MFPKLPQIKVGLIIKILNFSSLEIFINCSSEETNFLSIPLYSSERTGRERKKPLPKKFLDEWNKEIQERGDLNPKREIN